MALDCTYEESLANAAFPPAGPCEHREKDAGQDSDYRDHHQQLDQRETPAPRQHSYRLPCGSVETMLIPYHNLWRQSIPSPPHSLTSPAPDSDIAQAGVVRNNETVYSQGGSGWQIALDWTHQESLANLAFPRPVLSPPSSLYPEQTEHSPCCARVLTTRRHKAVS